MEESKTQKALRLLRENPDKSQYWVAKEVGLAQSVVSRACKALRERKYTNQDAQHREQD
jgi:DNA-binding IclR family transcriptional regulator